MVDWKRLTESLDRAWEQLVRGARNGDGDAAWISSIGSFCRRWPFLLFPSTPCR